MPISIEDKKAWLKRGVDVQKELQLLNDTRQCVYEDATHITGNMSAGRVSGSRSIHRFDKLAEVDGFIKAQERRLVELRGEILKAIYTVPTLPERELLTYKYIHGLPMEKLIEKLNYSDRHIKRIHKQALEKIQIPEHKGA